jgi:hypothetical protein
MPVTTPLPSSPPADKTLPSQPVPPPLPSSPPADQGLPDGYRYPRRNRKTTWKTIGLKNGYHTSHLTIRQASRQYPGLVDQAVRKEIRQLVERGTFVPVHSAPRGERVVHSSVMMTPKYGDNGELALMKGRLVAAGNEVDQSLYSREDTSSPPVSNLSMMAILACASFEGADIGAIDFPGAFLFATLGKHRFMWLGKDSVCALLKDFPEWKRYVKHNGTMMVRVEGALYGFAESGKKWYEFLSSFLVESGYSQSTVDPCVFSR